MKTLFSSLSRYTRADWARYIGFVFLNVAMATGGAYYVTHSLPPIRDEAMRWFVLPIGIISPVIFLVLYPLLRRVNPGIRRFLALYGAFNVALLSMTALFITLGLLNSSQLTVGEAIRLICVYSILIMGCGNLYGFVTLLGIAAVNKVFSRLFFPRLATTA